ncbi:dihydropteroate synthase [Candidatus Omnitrophota bacterium]
MIKTLAKKADDFLIECGGFSIDLASRTHIMGVLNRTPDSFSDGGRYLEESAALTRIEEMVREGADIIDIGGESTRPGAPEVSPDEELDRVMPVIEKAARNLNIPISIDTRKAKVAEEALKAGAGIVNDVTGLRGDPEMAGVVREHNAALIVMHIKGTPRTMQEDPVYGDLIPEIIESLAGSIKIAEEAGIPRNKIIIDPGIGFGKTVEHNLEIIGRIDEFKALGRPILLGTSRKSFIGKVLNRGTDDRIWGSAATSAIAVLKGVNVIRVHDVKEQSDVVRIIDAVAGRRRW